MGIFEGNFSRGYFSKSKYAQISCVVRGIFQYRIFQPSLPKRTKNRRLWIVICITSLNFFKLFSCNISNLSSFSSNIAFRKRINGYLYHIFEFFKVFSMNNHYFQLFKLISSILLERKGRLWTITFIVFRILQTNFFRRLWTITFIKFI